MVSCVFKHKVSKQITDLPAGRQVERLLPDSYRDL